jgi:glycosyltransferase involved in cell wall biosynthesis
MKVALNLVFLVPGETGGMENYARGLIAALAARQDVELVALVNREAMGTDFGVETRIVPVHARKRTEWVRGEQQHVPRMARAVGADIVHSLASTAPLWGRQRRVTTVHDLLFKLYPEAHFGLNSVGMRVLVPASARRSHRLITGSESSARDLVEHLGVDRSKIDVIPHGARSVEEVPATPEMELRTRLSLDDRAIVLCVGAKRPHKNLPRLLEAMAGIPGERRPVLVIPGYSTPHEAGLRDQADRLGIAGDVVIPQWVTDADLEGLYRLARLVAFPSLYEGFGLPPLEAMARGTPVVTSTRGAIGEVVGDAAVTFDPEDPVAIRTAIERVLGDQALADRLRTAGLRRAAEFTWERAADQTVATYSRSLSSAA